MRAKDATVGTRVVTNIAWFEVPIWSAGTIVEDYGSGVTVEWDPIEGVKGVIKDGFNKSMELGYLEIE